MWLSTTAQIIFLEQALLVYNSFYSTDQGLKTPDKAITNFFYKVNKWLDESTTSVFALLMVSTTIGFELTITLTSANKVFRNSLSKLLL